MSSEGDTSVDAAGPPTQPFARYTAGPGTTLADRYRLARCIAVGGMGSVWEAQDLRLDRRVAVKLPAADLAVTSPELVERFGREATAAARLSHPNVATVHDHGHEDEAPFIVMELLEGETLAARIRRGPLPESDAVAIAAQVASALDAAHAAGIVHRDVKPANIMLTASGVKVMDFGVASAEWAHTITSAGVLGTAAYLSPEQARGDSAVPASDVYSLGAVVFEMLAGRPPFVADTPVATVAAHVHRDPPPLSELAPGVSDHVARAVDRALAKDPTDRPPTPSAFAAMLEDADPAALDETAKIAPLPLVEMPADDEKTAVYALAPAMPDAPVAGTDQRRRWWWAAALLVLVVLAAAAWSWADDGGGEEDVPAATTEVTVASATVPDVVGQPVAAAMEDLRGAGLEVADVVTTEGAEGIVLVVDPGVGATVGPGTPVVLTVGDGNPPPPEPKGDEGDEGGPGNGRGNGKGNEKDD